MKVSIVMGVYNGEKYLAQQLDSLLGQSHTDLEVIASDDASTDESFKILENYATRDKRMRLVRNARTLGIKANFLTALHQAQGELVSFSDQDDVWHKDKIKILSGLLERDNRNTLAYSDLEICDQNLLPSKNSFWKTVGARPFAGRLAERSFIKIFVPGCSMMFRRKVADAMNRIHADTSFLHDHLALAVASGMGRVVYSPEKLVRYRQHGANLIGVFSPSKFNGRHFCEDLRRKAQCIQEANIEGLQTNFKKLKRFSEVYFEDNFFKRLLFVNYFLYLRNETLKEKAGGFFECFFPKTYRKIRNSL